ncbi:MAG: hypothetical protein RL199_162 [Pseudomonadota bacterium]|jgi:hypothetical protein
MSSPLHDIAVEALRVDPFIVLEAVEKSFPGVRAASERVFVADPVLHNLQNTEHRADLVLFLGDPKRPSRVVVVEVQVDPDDHKPWRWPLYVTTLADRHRCPVHLVVVAMRSEVATWSASLPQVSPAVVLRPVVFGPEVMPPPDELAAGHPTAARLLLSLGMHLRGRRDIRYLKDLGALVPAGVDDFGGWEDYHRLMAALLAKVLPRVTEDEMNIDLGEDGRFVDQLFAQAEARGVAKGRGQGHEQGREQGREEGRVQNARDLFMRLAAARGWGLTAPQLAQLHASHDHRLLSRWCESVVTARSVDEALSAEAL